MRTRRRALEDFRVAPWEWIYAKRKWCGAIRDRDLAALDERTDYGGVERDLARATSLCGALLWSVIAFELASRHGGGRVHGPRYGTCPARQVAGRRARAVDAASTHRAFHVAPAISLAGDGSVIANRERAGTRPVARHVAIIARGECASAAAGAG